MFEIHGAIRDAGWLGPVRADDFRRRRRLPGLWSPGAEWLRIAIINSIAWKGAARV